MANLANAPFWQVKSLSEMTASEWESLCDGCGKCCLHKLIDEDDPAETVHYTNVACRLLDCQTGRCSDYRQRFKSVPECVVIRPENVAELDYLPDSCAYRRLANGRSLPSWHPLRHNGSQEPMQAAGMSVAGRVVSETEAQVTTAAIVTWPLTDCD